MKGMGGGKGNRGLFFLYSFHVLYKQLSLQGKGGMRRGEKKAKAEKLERAMKGQWQFFFLCLLV
jgi:hypothetical protein